MTVMSTLRQGTPEIDKPKMTFPFLWRRNDGIVFIRSRHAHSSWDVYIGGTVALVQIGSEHTGTGVLDVEAWNQRLDVSESIVLRNFLS